MDTKKTIFTIRKFNIAFFLRSMLLMQPVMLLFYQFNGLTVKDFLFFQGIFYLASIIFEIPVGYLSDNFSRKKLIITSFSIYWGIILLWLCFKGYYIVLAGEILFALSKVIMDNTMSGYLYDLLNHNNLKEKMVKYYGNLNFYLSAGTAIAALIGTWLYKIYGVKFILECEILIMLATILIIFTLPDFEQHSISNFSQKLIEYRNAIHRIFRNPKIKYYILYSAILTSFSILFASSFQPLMQNAHCPIILFGIIASINHWIRALSGFVASKIHFNIKKLIIPLFFLYLIAFCSIFIILRTQKTYIVAALLFLICLIIGVQLLFTIMHVSRLHKIIAASKRGSLMAVNNIITRFSSAVFLLSSKLFIDKADLNIFFSIILTVFLIICSYTMIKTYRVEEKL